MLEHGVENLLLVMSHFDIIEDEVVGEEFKYLVAIAIILKIRFIQIAYLFDIF